MTTAQPDKETYRPGYETLAERLAQHIRSRGLHPGERLATELELSREFGVGRSVMREAIKVLSASGLIRARRGSGLFVGEGVTLVTAAIDLSMPVDPAHVLSLFEYRQMVEQQTARLAAERITPRELRSLSDALDLNRHAAAQEDVDGFLESDAAFHRLIAEATRNPFMVSTVATIFRLQHRAVDAVFGLPGSMLKSATQHAEILNAVRTGEPSLAVMAMDLHLTMVTEDYQREVRRRLSGDAE
jgi:GntR family transcriptional regulator, transcriptional repressor for pyruvate dehydrogenase complex